jgi:hypothetical protein
VLLSQIMSERKIIRTKFIPECNGADGMPKPGMKPARNVEVYGYQDGSKDIFCPNLSDRSCAISQTGDICVFLSGKVETSKIPPLFKRKETKPLPENVQITSELNSSEVNRRMEKFRAQMDSMKTENEKATRLYKGWLETQS